MEMDGIEHLFCSPQPIEKTLNDSYEVEVNAKKDKFRVIFFLLWSEKTCYGKLLQDFNRVAYKGIDEYPETVTGTYEISIRTTRKIGI